MEMNVGTLRGHHVTKLVLAFFRRDSAYLFVRCEDRNGEKKGEKDRVVLLIIKFQRHSHSQCKKLPPTGPEVLAQNSNKLSLLKEM